MTLQKIILPLAILVVAGIGIYYYIQSPEVDEQTNNILTTVERGEFKIFVTATGELKAKRSVKIRGPQGMRAAQIYQTTISDMVDEGTVVKEGEYVASLDRTELDTKMKEAQNELDKIETQLDQAKIDTAIELRGLRDELINLNFATKEKKLQVEQSQYEPQMVIQQAEIDLQKTKRDYQQLKKKYELTQQKSIAKISEIMASLRQEQLKLQRLVDLSQSFQIKAPKDGMVIYARNWNGKIGPGSQISTWNPIVAELPDLSDMISKTYVNEVDISKVEKGQDVNIKIDAFPDVHYSGRVLKVANIGEQLSGYDSKVFEVSVQLFEVDSFLRPAMTTSNEILTFTFPDMLHIPLESLQNDSLTYVFKNQKGKVVKQEVITGESNSDEIIVEHGLKEGDGIYLTIPKKSDELPFIPIDPKIKEEIRAKLEEARKKRQAEAREKAKLVKENYVPGDDSGGGGIIIFH